MASPLGLTPNFTPTLPPTLTPNLTSQPHQVLEELAPLPRDFVPMVADLAQGRGSSVSCADLGFLSATTGRQTALSYSGGRAARATLLELSFDYASRGADVQWVSQFPSELEVI